MLYMSVPACLTEDQGSKVTSYSGRRLLPTVAELLRYSADERVRLGGWLDAEEIEVSKKGTIADVYAGKKLDTSLILKSKLTRTVRTSVHNIRKTASTLELEQVIRRAPSRKTVRSQLMVNLGRLVQGLSLLTVKAVKPLIDASSSSSNMDTSSSSSAKVGFGDSTLVLVAATLPSDAQTSVTESVTQIARITNEDDLGNLQGHVANTTTTSTTSATTSTTTSGEPEETTTSTSNPWYDSAAVVRNVYSSANPWRVPRSMGTERYVRRYVAPHLQWVFQEDLDYYFPEGR
jgi:hypothetical protein